VFAAAPVEENAATAIAVAENRPTKRTFRGRDYTLKRAVALITKLKADYAELQQQARTRVPSPAPVAAEPSIHRLHSQWSLVTAPVPVPIEAARCNEEALTQADLLRRLQSASCMQASAGQRQQYSKSDWTASADCPKAYNEGLNAGVQLVFTEPNVKQLSTTDYRWMHDWNDAAAQTPARVFHADSCQCPLHALPATIPLDLLQGNCASTRPTDCAASAFSSSSSWTYSHVPSNCDSISSSACLSALPSPVPSHMDSSLSLHSSMFDETSPVTFTPVPASTPSACGNNQYGSSVDAARAFTHGTVAVPTTRYYQPASLNTFCSGSRMQAHTAASTEMTVGTLVGTSASAYGHSLGIYYLDTINDQKC